MDDLIKKSCRLFVFTDLDDTLFSSSKREQTDFSIAATVDMKGNPSAHSSIQQQKLLDIMVEAGAMIIPVTGRRSCSFLNCKLSVIANSKYSIVSHGAVILNEMHQLLDEWLVFIEKQFNLKEWQNTLTIIYGRLLNYFKMVNNGVRVRLIVDKGITAYICIKIAKKNYQEDKLREISTFLNSILPNDMFLHKNGRKFAILPPYAQKKVALDFLKKKMDVGVLDTVFGIGDSYSDLPFMSDSDFLIVPKQAQIFEKG